MLITVSQNNLDSNQVMEKSLHEYCRLFNIDGHNLRIIRECKRPLIQGADLNISLSHSHTKTVCVISADKVGIDIEYIKDRKYAEISRRFFERQASDLLDFYRLWTAKESYKKANDIPLINALRTANYESIRYLDIFNDYVLAIYGVGNIFIINL